MVEPALTLRKKLFGDLFAKKCEQRRKVREKAVGEFGGRFVRGSTDGRERSNRRQIGVNLDKPSPKKVIWRNDTVEHCSKGINPMRIANSMSGSGIHREFKSHTAFLYSPIH